MKSSAMRTTTEIVQKGSVFSHNFSDTRPNYFVIKNYGTTDLYMGVNNIPTNNIYDLKIAGGDQRVYGEDKQHSFIYIYNPSPSEDIRVKIISMEAAFDITTFAIMTMAESFGATLNDVTISTDGIIRGYETSLPAGSNTIGKVQIDGNTSLGINEEQVASLRHNSEDSYLFSSKANTSSTTISGVTYINFISNDDSVLDLTVTIGGTAIILKAGETLDDVYLPVTGKSVVLTGAPHRILYHKI